MKILLDTNVWISALLWEGKAREIIALAKHNQVIIYISLPLLNELTETLQSPKLESCLTNLEVTEFDLIQEVKKITTLCEPTSSYIFDLRDTKNLIIWSAALSIPVEAVVSEDEDLLMLKEFQGIDILTIDQFLTFYQNEQEK